MASRSEQRARNRADFPRTSAIVDEYREEFCVKVTLRWAAEGGKVLGNPPEIFLGKIKKKTTA